MPPLSSRCCCCYCHRHVDRRLRYRRCAGRAEKEVRRLRGNRGEIHLTSSQRSNTFNLITLTHLHQVYIRLLMSITLIIIHRVHQSCIYTPLMNEFPTNESVHSLLCWLLFLLIYIYLSVAIVWWTNEKKAGYICRNNSWHMSAYLI